MARRSTGELAERLTATGLDAGVRGRRGPAGRWPRTWPAASTSPPPRPSRRTSRGRPTSSPAPTGVVAGLPVAAAVFAAVGAGRSGSQPRAADGDRVRPRRRCCATVTGPTRDLLTAERTALNLLCHLSGVATADRAAGSTRSPAPAPRIRDTRKTTPGLRALEKYAVRCGGGVNHRMSLSDAALVKDNHVVAAGGVATAFARSARRTRSCRSRSRCDTARPGRARRSRPAPT